MMDPAAAPLDRVLVFGPFRMFPSRQLLTKGGRPIPIGTRAFAILELLADRAGNLVRKEALIAHVWPDTFVQEGNLKVHVAAVRRALADGRSGNRYIVTVPGRGYRFVGGVLQARAPRPPSTELLPVGGQDNFPIRLTRMIGREEIVRAITQQISLDRFVSLIGAGGIGKTTVALAVAEALRLGYRDGCRFVDMAPLSDPGLLPSALAVLMGIAVNSDDPFPQLLTFLSDKNILILLDSCEHMLDAAAGVAERLLRGAPGVHILATSREPLRAAGEVVRRLPPLETPSPSVLLTASQAITYPAIQLFLERSSTQTGELSLTDVDTLLAADICRRLDGNPLAIELAAGRVHAFGVKGVAVRLEDRFQLLISGRRTAAPRHQTLAATLDWSYELLPEEERAILRGLSIFAGDFKLDAGVAVAAPGHLSKSSVIDGIANLTAKSLVTANIMGAEARYRLLDTTRAYGRLKLIESAQYNAVAYRHAKYFCTLFERAESRSHSRNPSDWRLLHGPQVDDVRTALEWALSPNGSASVGIALTIAAVPLWLNLSLMDECRRRVKDALAHVSESQDATPTQELKLFVALGVALYSVGPGPESKLVWTQAKRIATTLKNADYRLRSLWGLWTVRVTGGKHRDGLCLAKQFLEIARREADPTARRVGARLVGTSRHFLGDHAAARRTLDRMLHRAPPPGNPSDIVRFQFDQAIAARAFLSKILWMEGATAKAMLEAQRSVADAQSIGHSLSLCYSLGQGACPVAFLIGDLVAAERWVAMLLEHSVRHGLALWATMGRGFEAVLRIRHGDDRVGVGELRQVVERLREAGFTLYHTAFLGELAEALGRIGECNDGLSTIDVALTQSKQNDERWCLPELLRVKATLLAMGGSRRGASAAEEHFQRSIQMARRHRALSWELRSTIGLARLRQSRNPRADIGSLLTPIYRRFARGLATTDLDAARSLLTD